MALTRNVALSNLANVADKENSKTLNNPVLKGKRGLGNITSKYNVLKPANTGKAVIKKEELGNKNGKLNPVKSSNVEKAVIKKEEVPMDISVCSANSVESQLPARMQMICIEDIDKDDGDQRHLLSDYILEIYEYLNMLEKESGLRENFMNDQQEVTSRMRAVLVDWLVQVHLRFHLIQETLFLTIAILDRYLQLHQVTKSTLQLVGVTAMWIACKYEEMYAPEIGDFVYITDNGYQKSAICAMERTICSALDFKFGCPLPIHFLRRFSKAGAVDSMEHTMAKYFMELSLIDYDICHRYPSIIAASSLFLSIKIHNENAEWTSSLTYYSGYTEDDIKPLVYQIANLLMRTSTATKLVAVRTKYQGSKYLRVAKNELLNSPIVQKYAEMHLIGS